MSCENLVNFDENDSKRLSQLETERREQFGFPFVRYTPSSARLKPP